MSKNVSIVGASGAVGQELLRLLEERAFPVHRLRLFGSERSEGTEYLFKGEKIRVERLQHGEQFHNTDIVFTSAGASVSREYAADITRYGAVMIDNSSAFRMEEDVPLVVPEINPADAFQTPRNIIANPNCSTIIMALPLYAIHRLSPVRRVHVATYQAASGAGAQAMAELEEQHRQIILGNPVTIQKFPRQLAYNLIPHIDIFTDNDYTREEIKMHYETRKIFHSLLSVSATCVRVPVLRCHSEAVWVETEQPIDVSAARDAIARFSGCVVQDVPSADEPYPMPLFASGKDDVFVGRIRKDITNPNTLTFWCVSDQIRKGAALNALQIAEQLR